MLPLHFYINIVDTDKYEFQVATVDGRHALLSVFVYLMTSDENN